ncbi:hypothetical protein Pint_26725 [Pistacia integerrima]|uniref:Uncharacterized protein n=1 Tax=Pistacia integerrima TaxID=434235 RepID=A0ACC0YRY6_9ROSI|nr:hypothetical protein Pint_26725 [Pistacia integerrima]
MNATLQGLYIGGGVEGSEMGFSGPVNSVAPVAYRTLLFVISCSRIQQKVSPRFVLELLQLIWEYGHWVEEQNWQICELRFALQARISDIERFALQARISDIELHILVEGGMSHYLELFRMKSTAAKADAFYVMSGMWKTAAEFSNLRQSCQLVEDSLSQGIEKLQSTLAETVAAGQLVEGGYIPQIPTAMEKLEAIVSFVN